jgi:hypothetical protein
MQRRDDTHIMAPPYAKTMFMIPLTVEVSMAEEYQWTDAFLSSSTTDSPLGANGWDTKAAVITGPDPIASPYAAWAAA